MKMNANILNNSIKICEIIIFVAVISITKKKKYQTIF